MMQKTKNSPSHLALLDIGSNAVRLSIFELQGQSAINILKQNEMCQMGRSHDGTGLYPPGVQHAFDTLSRYCQIIRAPQYRIDGIVAVATDALRRASDGPSFIAHLEKDLNLKVRIIDETAEGTYGAKGVLSKDPDFTGIVADLGGGSLQLTRVKDRCIHETASRPLGVLRLATIQGNLTGFILDQLKTVPDSLSKTDHLCIIGGSWRTFAKLYLARAGGDPAMDLQGLSLDPAKIKSMASWLNSGDVEASRNDLKETYHLEPKRIEALPHAAIALATLIDQTNAKKITVSSAGIRDGLLQDVLAGTLVPDPVPKGHVASISERSHSGSHKPRP